MMSFLSKITISLLLISLPSLAPAQELSAASSEAKARLACGGGTVLGAEFLPGGLLKVTCSRNAAINQVPNALQGTGLTPPVAIGVVISVVVFGIAVGGNGTTTTTTSTSGN